jgi:transglutaminase-like putative cysteine protease
MRLLTGCDFEFDISVPTPFVLMLRPRSGAQQWIFKEEYEFFPPTSAVEFTDDYGNLCQRLMAPQGHFRIHTAAEVEAADQMDLGFGAAFVEVQNLPEQVLQFLLPSRYCESDRFGQMGASISAGAQPGYDQVASISSWVRSTINYLPGTSHVPLSAVEVHQQGSGVCRDLAHLGIALCRSLSIPARMVVGYLEGLTPMDLHAWFEAYVGGRWYTFDATQAELHGGYVALGIGRDATDVAVYNQFGPPLIPTSSLVTVRRSIKDLSP